MKLRALATAAAVVFLAARASMSRDWAQTTEDRLRAEIEITAIGQEISSAADTVAPPTGEDRAGSVSGRLTLAVELAPGLSAVLTAEGWDAEPFHPVKGWDGQTLDPDDDLYVLAPVNGDIALESNEAVSEAYLTARPEGMGLRISAGKVDVSDLFDRNRVATDPRTQFTNYSFCNATAVEYPGGEDAPYTLAAWITLEDPGRTAGLTVGGADMGGDDNELYLFGELRLRRGRRFAAGVFGWKAEGPHPYLDPARTDVQDSATGWGAYLDWEPRGDIGIFARTAYADAEVSRIDHSWSAGLQIRGTPWGRAGDTFGIAYAVNGTSGDDPPTDADEEVLEVYYNLSLLGPDADTHRPGIDISPHHQTIKNAGGVESNSKVQLWGLRLRVLVMF